MSDPPQHSGKHILMKGIDHIPVRATQQADRIEDRRLTDGGFALAFSNFKLEPGPSGHLHFRGEAQSTIRLYGFNAPAIHRVADAETLRVAAAPAQSHAAD